MKLLVGLGNPGIQYELTRHNIGFLVLDELAIRHGIRISKKAYHSRYGEGKIAEEEVILLKPMTFMNLSGKAVRSLLEEGRFSLRDLLVVHDDIDLPLGTIRKKKKGGDAGHKGIRSIIESVESPPFFSLLYIDFLSPSHFQERYSSFCRDCRKLGFGNRVDHRSEKKGGGQKIYIKE